MKLRKRQLLLASLVLALSAAVYLNWQFSENKNLTATDVIETSKELGQARFVNKSNQKELQDFETTQVANMNNDTKQYFDEASVNRQKAREESIEFIKKTLSGDKAETQVAEISKIIQQESNIENLIKAKGYSECLAFIQNGECRIVINPSGINESTAIVICDIVSGQTGISYDKIKIIEANNKI